MSAKRIRKYKTSKIKAFILFLFLAIVFWGLTKFSNEYSSQINVAIEYENIPESRLLSSSNKKEISFDINANGFELLMYQLKMGAVSLDVGKYFVEGNTQVEVSSEELKQIILDHFGSDMQLRTAAIEGMIIELERIVHKNVEIVPNLILKFKEGYKAIGDIKTSPDSVTVSGSTEQLEMIDSLLTLPYTYDNIDDDISEIVKLDETGLESIQLSENEVKLEVKVEEFTQKDLTIKMDVINMPEGILVKLIPESVNITFTISVSEFNSIDEDDFLIVCDFFETK